MGCAAEAAASCLTTKGCVAFSVRTRNVGSFQLHHNTARVLNPYPDADWTYYVDTKPFPSPPKPPPDNDFKLPTGVSFFVSMSTAMASDTSMFKLGMVSITSVPDIFGGKILSGSFSQELDISSAMVTVAATTSSNITATISVTVDANSNQIMVNGSTSVPVKFSVEVQSVHPSTGNFTYGGHFGGAGPLSGPDMFGDSSIGIDHISISHRNEDTDLPAAFNDTLTQQGLASLIPTLQSSDRWRHRQFGMAISGVGLRRSSPSMLVASTPSSSLSVTITTHSNQTTTAAEWTRQLFRRHTRHGSGSIEHIPEIEAQWRDHHDWWRSFWNRSHIRVNKSDSSARPPAEDLAILSQQYAITRCVVHAYRRWRVCECKCK